MLNAATVEFSWTSDSCRIFGGVRENEAPLGGAKSATYDFLVVVVVVSIHVDGGNSPT